MRNLVVHPNSTISSASREHVEQGGGRVHPDPTRCDASSALIPSTTPSFDAVFTLFEVQLSTNICLVGHIISWQVYQHPKARINIGQNAAVLDERSVSQLELDPKSCIRAHHYIIQKLENADPPHKNSCKTDFLSTSNATRDQPTT